MHVTRLVVLVLLPVIYHLRFCFWRLRQMEMPQIELLSFLVASRCDATWDL